MRCLTRGTRGSGRVCDVRWYDLQEGREVQGETGLGVRRVSGDADADGERRGEVVSGPFPGIQSQSEGRGLRVEG